MMRERRGGQFRDPLLGLIVYEDGDILVVNKPPGMLTSSGTRDRRPTLWRTVQERALMQGQRTTMGLIHRLDKEACGLLVFSKHDEAYNSLKKQFFRHTVERRYMAIVRGKPKEQKGRVENHLVEWKDGTVHSTKRPHTGEKAISHYEVHQILGKFALVRVKLETGRKHQIRVHLSEMGCPIVGDTFYSEGKWAEEQLMLVALRLCLDHPRRNERMEFEIPLPQHLRTFLKGLQH